jgi:hypothetical protein
MPMTRPPTGRAARAVAVLVGALALLAALAGSALAAEPATLRLMGSSPTYGAAVDVHKAAGGTVRVRPARYHYRVTQGTQTTDASGYCVDLSHYIVTGRDYPVELQTAADAPELGGPGFTEAGWLLSRSDELIAGAPDAQLEAAAIQVAVWQLSGQARELAAPTSDPLLNARVSTLRALASGRRLPGALDISVAGPPTCLDQAATVTVTGTPGTAVDLAVTSGQGTVAPAQVTVGDAGTAEAQLRGTAAGDVTVTATASAPLLVRATKLAGSSSPQDQLLLRPGTLTAEATHRFTACDLFLLAPGGPGGALRPAAPGAPAVPGPADPGPAPADAPLALTMSSPRIAAPGGVAVYRIRVANRGRTEARGVTVAQRLGRGLAALRARGPKGATARVAGGVARWRLAALAPGRAASLSLTVRVARTLAGDVGRSTAAARAGGTTEARASGTTAVVRRVGKTEQGF